jgi:multiple sugar transport system permease protein
MPTSVNRKSRLGALPWIFPALFIIFGFVLWPAFEMIRTSFQEVSTSGITKGWAGLENYRTLFVNPDLPNVLIRTFIWVVGIVFFTILISLPVAQLLNANYLGRKLVRWAVIIPWAASVVMSSTIWKWILDPYYGVLNKIAIDLNIFSEPIDFLANPKHSFVWLMLVAVFVSIPFTSFVILAGLSTIPDDIVEASTVDGATAWKGYRHIKFPLIKPALLVAMAINLINIFNAFPIIWVITGGGPGYETDTTTTLGYKISFRDQDIGQSASMASINLIIILVFIGIFLKVSKSQERNS